MSQVPSVPSRRPADRREYRATVHAARLDPTDRAILLALSLGRDGTPLDRVQDDAKIAARVGIDRSTLYRRLPRLIAAGWLVKERRRRGNRQTNSLYRLTLPLAATAARPSSKPASAPVKPAAQPAPSLASDLAAARREAAPAAVPALALAASADPWADPIASYRELAAAASDVFGPRPGTSTRERLSRRLVAFHAELCRRHPCEVDRGEAWHREVALVAADALRHGLDAPDRFSAARWAYAQLTRALDSDVTYDRLKAARAIPEFDLFAALGGSPFREVPAA